MLITLSQQGTTFKNLGHVFRIYSLPCPLAACGKLHGMRTNKVIGTRRRFPRKYVIAAAMFLVACEPQVSAEGQKPVQVVALPSPAGPGSAEPHLALVGNANAGLVLSWQAIDGDMASLNYARLEKGAWSKPVRVAQGDNWFVNWADYPSVEPMADGRLAAHWLVKRDAGTYAYDVWISLSADGASWGEPFIAHHDGTSSEHGFVSLFPWAGNTGAVWLDGRETSGGEHEHDHEDSGDAGMTLRFGLFDAQGLTVQEGLVDELTCDCCQTDTALAGDALVLAYRDRTQEEFRDIAVSRYDGQTWSEPVLVDDQHWTISGCPVNGPAISARGEDVAVAWFTGAAGTGQVKAAISRDGGRSFGPPIMLDPAGAIGRVDIAWLDEQDLAVSWMGRADPDADLKVMRLQNGTAAGEALTVTHMSESRRSGFPQMVLQGNKLVFAWTEVGENNQVRVATLDISAL